jgi:uridine kinase
MNLPLTIGITGGSGSGKTFFIEALSSYFRPEEICLISQDHYYKPRELQFVDEKGIQNFDLPGAIEREQFHADLLKLKKGKAVQRKEYTFNNPDVSPKMLEFRAAPIIIIEGLFVQFFPEIERELDLKIFIEAKDHLKLSRRIIRDNAERGYPLDDVLYRYQHHVMPVFESIIEPLKHSADFIIPNNHNFERALSIIVDALKARLKK